MNLDMDSESPILRARVSPVRSLVLHADDFGMSEAVNRGILTAFTHGILTSTSLLANAPAVAPALQSWNELELRRRHRVLPGDTLRRELRDPALPFDLGVHLNLTQGRPLTSRYPVELLDREGRFPGIGRLFLATVRSLPRGTAELVRDELATQVESLLEAGAPLRHLNGHQYVECLPLVAELIPGIARQYGLESVRVACEDNLGRVLAEGRWTAWTLSLVKRMFARRWRKKALAAQLAFADSYVGTAHAGLWDSNSLAWCLDHALGNRLEVGLHPGARPMEGWQLVAGAPVPTSARPASRVGNGDIEPEVPVYGSQAAGMSQAKGVRKPDDSAVDGWNDPLAEGRPRELALLTAAAFATRLAASGWILGRLAELGRTGAFQGWRKAS